MLSIVFSGGFHVFVQGSIMFGRLRRLLGSIEMLGADNVLAN